MTRKPDSARADGDGDDGGDDEHAHAESYGRFLRVCEAGDLAEATRLVQSGAIPSLSLQDHDGWAPLHYAASSGNPALVSYLLQNGALWAIVDKLGYNAGDVAFSMNHRDIYEMISNEGFRAEVLRRTIEGKEEKEGEEEVQGETSSSTATNNAAFLRCKLTFTTSRTGQPLCVDAEGNGVMQGWEGAIMKATAGRLCERLPVNNNDSGRGLSVLNVGFGLGIIDGFFQEHKPARHVIVEPHPDVLAHITQQGWLQRPGVLVYPGRWQDFLREVHAGTIPAHFDAVYWDTFSEDYQALKHFFDNVFDLLSGPTARFSWFHGLGATSRTLYDIYTEMAEMDIRDAGLKVSWSEVPVDVDEGVWEGIKRRYWDIPSPYRLPICTYDV